MRSATIKGLPAQSQASETRLLPHAKPNPALEDQQIAVGPRPPPPRKKRRGRLAPEQPTL